jgi:ferric-dicitrate binding protein FerR (iron transport regulator)
LVALVQEELSPDRAGEIRAHLGQCPACLEEERRVLDTLNLTRLVRKEIVPLPGDLFGRIESRLSSPPAPRSAAPASASNAVFAVAAAAALLLCTAAGVTLLLNGDGTPAPEEPAARLSYLAGDAVESTDGVPRPAPPGSRIGADSEVRVNGRARIDLDANVRLTVEDGTLSLGRSRCTLHDGTLGVDVRKGVAFLVRTPHGNVRVFGTRFLLLTTRDALNIHVLEGRVAVETPRGSLTLHPGQAGCAPRAGPPRRTREEPPGGAGRLLHAETLFLELHRPDPRNPALLEFRLTNLTDRPLLLPDFHPDQPLFSLKIRSGSSPRMGVVNLARFLVDRGAPPTGPSDGRVRLFPGRSHSLRFDVGPLLWMEGSHEVTGIFQAPRNRGLWGGQVLSQPLEVRVGPGGGSGR